MESLEQSIGQSEQTVKFLSEQLSILTALAAQKKGQNEEKEIERISKQNEQLRNEVTILKRKLRYYEVQNGVPQVDLPTAVTAALPQKSKLPEVKAEKKED